MPQTASDPAVRMRQAWELLHRLPGGRWLFSRFLAYELHGRSPVLGELSHER